jgi:biotin transporter BioY
MKKLIQVVVLAFTLVGAVSAPVFADGTPYPTVPPGK